MFIGNTYVLYNPDDEIRKNSITDESKADASVDGYWIKPDSKIEGGLAYSYNKEAAKYMLKNDIKGNILNVTSVAGNEPVFGAYSASKIAASGLTRGWGKMFAADGITISGIAPGPVATEMNNWHDGDPLDCDSIPYGRFATIEEIAELAKYMLDENAKMLCGEVIVFDGAYAIR